MQGVGEDNSKYADLSHFLLGICSTITREMILEVFVTEAGVEIPVEWGENVEIKTAEKPDNPTGCVGLKFDFSVGIAGGNCFGAGVSSWTN